MINAPDNQEGSSNARQRMARRGTARGEWIGGRGRTARLGVTGCLALLLIGCNAVGRTDSHGWVVTGIAPVQWPADTVAPVAIPLSPAWDVPDVLAARITFDDRPARKAVVQCERMHGTGDRHAWVMMHVEPEERGQHVTIELLPDLEQVVQPIYALNYDGRSLHVRDDLGRPALTYVHGTPLADAPYPFTSYFHPIFGLDGEILTDVYPADHRHHRGLFCAWVRHEHEGTSLGSWWQPRSGGVRSVPEELTFHSGPVFARFHSRHWLVHRAADSGDEARFLQDDVICRLYPATESGRAIDIEIALLASMPGIRLGGTTDEGKGYGGLTFRFAPADDVEIRTDGTLLDDDGINHRAHWADWSGTFKTPEGQAGVKPSGAAILVHPGHPDYPTEWLLRHYGILNVSFPGVAMLDISTDDPLILRYRLWVHRGDARAGRVEAQGFAYSADWQWRVAPTEGAGNGASRSTSDRS